MVQWLDAMVRHFGPVGILVLFVCALIEYVFPPFPGDTVTLLGGIYAVRGEQPVAAVFGAVMAGSIAGAAIDWFAGRWLAAKLASGSLRSWKWISPEQIAAWEERFRRRGNYWLLANRFFPGIRGPIFLAAGISGIPLTKVVLLGGVSALLWNALLFAAGYGVGGQAERLQALVSTYSTVAWGLLAAVVLGLVARALLRRRRRA